MARLSARDEARLKQYEALLANEPKALVFAALASLYARKYEFEKAIDVLAGGLAVYPNYFSARVLLAKCYIALDRFDDARAQLDQVLTYDPYNISALGVAGDELRNRGRFAEARDLYLKILEFEPENEEYAYKLELLETLMEGGPFAERPAAAAAVIDRAAPPPPVEAAPPRRETPLPTPEERPAAVHYVEPTVPPPAEEETPAGVDTFDLELMAADKGPPAAAAEEPAPRDEKLATLTLARIYEDQGLFLRAREVIAKVLAHEPGNEAARRADAHLVALLAGEQSPSGESIIQLIKKVEAAAGLLEEDEVELWATAAAGVTEVLTGFETLTLARAVAAAAGLQGADEFICLSTDAPATWELELPPVPLTLGAAGAEEWDIILPFKVGGQYVTGLSVLDVTVPAAPGVVGTDEFELPARGRRPVNVEVDDFVLDLKAAVAAHRGAAPARAAPVITRAAPASSRRVETPPAPAPEPVIEPEPAPADELAVRPERYLEKRPSTLPEQTLKKDDDFLGWLDSIKLREI